MAAPAPPKAGQPNQPYIKNAFNGAFKASMPIEMYIVILGRDTAAFKEMNARPAKAAGKPITQMER